MCHLQSLSGFVRQFPLPHSLAKTNFKVPYEADAAFLLARAEPDGHLILGTTTYWVRLLWSSSVPLSSIPPLLRGSLAPSSFLSSLPLFLPVNIQWTLNVGSTVHEPTSRLGAEQMPAEFAG